MRGIPSADWVVAMFGVLAIEGRGAVEEYTISEQSTTLGRAPDADVVLQHPSVSRYHARLIADSGGLRLIDLGSANGTFLNSVEIPVKEPRAVSDGDAIGIGPFRVVYHTRPVARPVTPAAASPGAGGPRSEPTVVLAPPRPPRLIVKTPEWTREFPLQKDVVTFGRDHANDITVESDVVSRHHAQLERRGGQYEISDLGSTNGLTRDGKRVERVLLEPGDVLEIGRTITVEYRGAEESVGAGAGMGVFGGEGARPTTVIRLPGQQSVTIGRSEDADVSLVHPQVNREHARLDVQQGRYVIEDLGSASGTFVNGQRVQQQVLAEGDVVRIGPHRMLFEQGRLEAVSEEGCLRLDAYHLSVTVGKGQKILQDVSVSILPQEFVAVVGASGAGKSTMMNALCGFRPATGGGVFLNGVDLYKHFDAYRSELGYVPQDDIIHRELTIRKALEYAARLRMPGDTTADERERRVAEVLAELDLTARADVAISRLSGGQRKRVSIGVELLTRPSLFFLDEATSGLDPGTEAQMMKLLRHLADGGRTVVLVTHATKNVMMCDRVIILARGGYLAFYGPPDEALEYFGVKEFDEIYGRLDSAEPQALAERFARSPQFIENVQSRLVGSGAPQAAAFGGFGAGPGQGGYGLPYGAVGAAGDPSRGRGPAPGAKVRKVSSFKQFRILSRRYLEIIWRDKKTAALLLLISPLLGALDFFTWGRNLFDPVNGNATKAVTMLFMLSLITILVGTITSVREIVKEDAVYRRERMVGVRVLPYVGSKVAVGMIFAIYSAVVLYAFMMASVNFGGHFQSLDYLVFFVPFFLGTFAGLMWGLLVSAVAPSEDRAMLLVILVLVPQFIFSGGMIPVDDLGSAGKVLGYVTSTRWQLGALATSAKIKPSGATAADFSDSGVPGIMSRPTVAERQAYVGGLDNQYGDIFNVNVAYYWLMSAALAMVLLSVTFWLQKRKDTL